MTKSPYIQEVSVKCLAEGVERGLLLAHPGYAESPTSLTVQELERLMHVKVSVTAPDDSKSTESLYSILVGIFKDRRGRIVRACKKAISKIVDDIKIAESPSTPTKKFRTGGFTGPPVPKSNAPVYGFQRSIVTLTEKVSPGPPSLVSTTESLEVPAPATERTPPSRQQKIYVRVVERGIPHRDDEELVDADVPDLYTVKIFKFELAVYTEEYTFYKKLEPGEIEFDFPEHPCFLAYFAHVCDECNVRVPTPPVGIRLASQQDIVTSAPSHLVALITCDRHGNVIEVSGTCDRFDAFVACQV
jgi:hypothetical protein